MAAPGRPRAPRSRGADREDERVVHGRALGHSEQHPGDQRPEGEIVGVGVERELERDGGSARGQVARAAAAVREAPRARRG